jgi:hypothetical protein
MNMTNDHNTDEDNTLEEFVNADDANINLEARRRRERAARFGEELKGAYAGMFEETGSWLKEYFVAAGRGLSVPFAIASAARRSRDDEPVMFDTEGIHDNAEFAGMVTAVAGYACMIIGDVLLIAESVVNKNSDWRYTLIPVATNVVDWLVYEPLRKAWIESGEERERGRR